MGKSYQLRRLWSTYQRMSGHKTSSLQGQPRVVRMRGGWCLQVMMIVVAGGISSLASAGPKDRWKCQLDLHQGDVGRLNLVREGVAVSGVLRVDRGRQVHQVSGDWQDKNVRFRRTLDRGRGGAHSIQDFEGIVLYAPDGQVRMAGRFAAGFNGVWSADCILVGREYGKGRIIAPIDGLKPPPGRRLPSEPDRRGIPPLKIKPGRLRSKLTACTIEGRALGPRADLSKVYFVELRGLDNKNAVSRTEVFKANRYRFEKLPVGRYRLRVDTRADLPVRVEPFHRVVRCTGKRPTVAHFKFR